jgi:hypothetical protein
MTSGRDESTEKNLLCVANAMKYLKQTQNIYNTIMKDTNLMINSKHKNGVLDL